MNKRALVLIIALILLVASGLYYFARDKEWFKDKEEKTETNITEDTEKAIDLLKAEALARSILGTLEREYQLLSRNDELIDKEYFVENGFFVDEELRGPARLIEEGKLIITSAGENAFVVVYDNFCATKGLNDDDVKVVEHESICMHEDLPGYEIIKSIEND